MGERTNSAIGYLHIVDSTSAAWHGLLESFSIIQRLGFIELTFVVAGHHLEQTGTKMAEPALRIYGGIPTNKLKAPGLPAVKRTLIILPIFSVKFLGRQHMPRGISKEVLAGYLLCT
jgi:hypothetical protein